MTLAPSLIKDLIVALREAVLEPVVEKNEKESLITYELKDVIALFSKQEKLSFKGLVIIIDDYSIAISEKLELALLAEDDSQLTLPAGKLEEIATAYLRAKILSINAFGA